MPEAYEGASMVTFAAKFLGLDPLWIQALAQLSQDSTPISDQPISYLLSPFSGAPSCLFVTSLFSAQTFSSTTSPHSHLKPLTIQLNYMYTDS